METSLHRQLKRYYAGSGGEIEVRRGSYRIDAVRGDLLVEVQHSGLAAIRDKVRALLRRHRVLVVKPIVVRKRIEKCARAGGPVVSSRKSPKQGCALDFFDELVHFSRVFPHERLSIETPLVEIAEVRHPGHGRRRRRRQTDFEVSDQRLLSITEVRKYRRAADLLTILPTHLELPFDTATLAAALGVSRATAQRVAYCLRTTGACRTVGKRGNSILYEPTS